MQGITGIIFMFAVVLELAYRLDLKSSALWDCGFKSRLPHHQGTFEKKVSNAQPITCG